MNWSTSKYKEIGETPYFFFSNRFFNLNNQIKRNQNFLQIALSDYFEIISGFAFKSADYVDDGLKLLRIGDFSNLYGIEYSEMVSLPHDYEDQFSRFKIENGDILIAMTGATIGKLTLVEEKKEPILLNQRVGLLRKKKNFKIKTKVIEYLLRQKTLQIQILVKSMGKSQPNVSPFDILTCKIPVISLPQQDEIENSIIEIEREIRHLIEKRKEPLEIINDIFAKEFKFSPELWKEFGKGMTAGTQKSDPRTLNHFPVQSTQVSLSSILRFSSRFHNPITIQLNEILEVNELWRVEDVVSDIKKGIQPSYNTDGEVKVVKIANMKNGFIDFTEAEHVSEEFFESVKDKAGINQGDILLCCTGKVSLGKIDYYDLDEPSILSVDSYIIRVNEEKVHPLFFTYFFRGILGAYQIERDYTGTTNQIHLYESQIRGFRLPNINIKRQQKIVDQVKKSLDAQKEIKNLIEEKQNEICKIIEDVMKESL